MATANGDLFIEMEQIIVEIYDENEMSNSSSSMVGSVRKLVEQFEKISESLREKNAIDSGIQQDQQIDLLSTTSSKNNINNRYDDKYYGDDGQIDNFFEEK